MPLSDLTGELLVGLLVEASDLTTRELGRLACTAKHFRRELLEEVARLRVERLPAAQQEWAPRRAHQRWLRVLKELELLQRPLAFSTAGSSRANVRPCMSPRRSPRGSASTSAACAGALTRALPSMKVQCF